MKQYEYRTDDQGNAYLETDLPGLMLTRLPLLNKSTAFTQEERDTFGLHGILPPHISTLTEQVDRTYANYSRFNSDLNKHVYLRLLQDRNEVLFYSLLERHLEEMMPIIYTPTVAEAVEEFSHLYRFPRGLVVSTENIDRVDELLNHTPYPYIKLIVATDSEGILGIGDQGFGGIAICIGKLSLYTAAAGVDPALTLPIQLDVGTNSEKLLNDPLYLGMRHERLVGDPYYEFMDKFVTALKKRFPNVLLQWEDFSRNKAFGVLERFEDTTLSFNDDIQGTGAVVLAGLLAAERRTGRPLTEETFLVYGAGAGGVGVARQIYEGLRYKGLSEDEAKDRIYMMDRHGVIWRDRPKLEDYKRLLAKDSARLASWQFSGQKPSLPEIVRNAGVTALIGLSGRAGDFTQDVVKAVAQNSPRPIVFPLSNPTANSEATPEQIFNWTEGRAIVATGSPFPDVSYDGRSYPVSQGNNAFVFPGVGLGVMLSGATRVTGEMLTAASLALAEFTSQERLDAGAVYPAISEIREASQAVAVAVIQETLKQNLARVDVPEDIQSFVAERMWRPRYFPIRKPQ